jgi:hypothetical protein
MRFPFPGLPERNPGLKLANAFSVLPDKDVRRPSATFLKFQTDPLLKQSTIGACPAKHARLGSPKNREDLKQSISSRIYSAVPFPEPTNFTYVG